MSYTQEMQLLSYYAQDVFDLVMSHSHDVDYRCDRTIGHFCGLTVDFGENDFSSISCPDFELVFQTKKVEQPKPYKVNAANDAGINRVETSSSYSIFASSNFRRGTIDDLRRWRLKLHQYRQTAA